MQSGIVYGYVGLVDGLVERILAELGYPCAVIATGGLASLIAPLSRTIDGGRRRADAHRPAHPLRPQPGVGENAVCGAGPSSLCARSRCCVAMALGVAYGSGTAGLADLLAPGHARRTDRRRATGCRASCSARSPAQVSRPSGRRSRACCATRSPIRTSSASPAARRSARPSPSWPALGGGARCGERPGRVVRGRLRRHDPRLDAGPRGSFAAARRCSSPASSSTRSPTRASSSSRPSRNRAACSRSCGGSWGISRRRHGRSSAS